ncbi:hypothetical protein CBR_g51343 [Chara braunii]|uniref:Uncharacterized protein n=1 Tax=Chara braunii TaxID=69332 RepID=A0A388M8C8_CHABU|nr:hypothetical protein CBR_g51343 [Chara braunii]|eukprot:GBG90838.1 hypothetical protein CBR_g51343 [Chara braunii]
MDPGSRGTAKGEQGDVKMIDREGGGEICPPEGRGEQRRPSRLEQLEREQRAILGSKEEGRCREGLEGGGGGSGERKSGPRGGQQTKEEVLKGERAEREGPQQRGGGGEEGIRHEKGEETGESNRREVSREGEEEGTEKGRHEEGREEEEADKQGQSPRETLLIGGMKRRPQGTKRPRLRRKSRQREGKVGNGRKGKQVVMSSSEHSPSPKRCREETEKGVLPLPTEGELQEIFGESRSILGVPRRRGTREKGSHQGYKTGRFEGEESTELQEMEEKRGGSGTVEDAAAGAAEPTETDERSLEYLGEDPGGGTKGMEQEAAWGSGGEPGQEGTAELKKWGRGREEMPGARRAVGEEGVARGTDWRAHTMTPQQG